jgi:hypothetical protein
MTSTRHDEHTTAAWQRVRDERGIALLSVLGVLAVMLVLASLMATSSQTEARLSGVGEQSARAFAAADAGLGYALSDPANWTQLGKRCTDLKTAGMTDIPGNVCVIYNRTGPPPVKVKVSAVHFSAFIFDVSAVGTAQTNATTNLAMEAARLGPAQ